MWHGENATSGHCSVVLDNKMCSVEIQCGVVFLLDSGERLHSSKEVPGDLAFVFKYFILSNEGSDNSYAFG